VYFIFFSKKCKLLVTFWFIVYVRHAMRKVFYSMQMRFFLSFFLLSHEWYSVLPYSRFAICKFVRCLILFSFSCFCTKFHNGVLRWFSLFFWRVFCEQSNKNKSSKVQADGDWQGQGCCGNEMGWIIPWVLRPSRYTTYVSVCPDRICFKLTSPHISYPVKFVLTYCLFTANFVVVKHLRMNVLGKLFLRWHVKIQIHIVCDTFFYW